VGLDSVGLALQGDAGNARDVITFFRESLDRLREEMGITSILVDHQGKLAQGESYQSKTMFGSGYKGFLVRSRIQAELKDRGTSARGVILRQNKTNFSAEAEPFKVRVEFSEERIVLVREDLHEDELQQERTLNLNERVLLALQDGPAAAPELAERLESTPDSVRVACNRNHKDGHLKKTGEKVGRADVWALTDEGQRHIQVYFRWSKQLVVNQTNRTTLGADTVATVREEPLSFDAKEGESTTVAELKQRRQAQQEESVVEENDFTRRAREALSYGNAPQKALEHYRNGDQDLHSLTRSVMNYYGRGRDDVERWEPAVRYVLTCLEDDDEYFGEGE
jgi:hypothetical protein